MIADYFSVFLYANFRRISANNIIVKGNKISIFSTKCLFVSVQAYNSMYICESHPLVSSRTKIC
jgi:hypothetical protein